MYHSSQLLQLLLTALLCLPSIMASTQDQAARARWVDQTIASMSTEEKIGQLIMVRAHTEGKRGERALILNQINKYHIGGICFFQGDPTRQVKYTNQFQHESKTPLLIAIDGEWGLGMRHKSSTISYPRQLTLGAIQDNTLIYEMGSEVARQMRRLGIHVNFAPVVDVNNNPRNPVINDRSFGEDRYNVAAKSYAYMKGMQAGGLMACAKHFPGHGDTDVDSHYGLPVLDFDRARLDSLELMPFRSLADQGISSMMIAHLQLPKIDPRSHRPATLSAPIIEGILRQEMGYDGLLFTDAMEMKGVADHFPDGISDAEAIVAGNDIILLPNDVAKTVQTIKAYLADGRLTEARIDKSVRRILRAKYDYGVHLEPVRYHEDNVLTDINTERAVALRATLIEHAVTVVRDQAKLLPIPIRGHQRYAVLSIGSATTSVVGERIRGYAKEATVLHTSKDISRPDKEILLRQLKLHDHVVITLHDMSKYASRNYGLTASTLDFIATLVEQKQATIVLFGSPYAAKYLEGVGTVVVAYEDDAMTQDIIGQALFGAIDMRGKLPVTAATDARYGDGLYIPSNGTLGYSLPERVGLSSRRLGKIDSLMQEMIAMRAAPGAQVLVAKNGRVVWHKSYGHHTYRKAIPVQNDHIYDVASVTKVAATTLSLMKLYGEDRLDLRSPLRRYVPETDTCDKRDIIIEDMLAHQARLPGWIPFYKQTISDTKYPKPLDTYYAKTLSSGYSVPVADELFMRTDYIDSIWSRIYACELRDDDTYRYSDLGFYLADKIVQSITKQPLQAFVAQTFYQPLGLQGTGYSPLSRHDKAIIVPTEEDTYYRNQRLHGYVHDMGAAMLGGAAGHAGLFSTAHDLAILLQMVLNGGTYGGDRYLTQQAVDRFTTRYYRSTRRGIGWDMKETDPSKRPNMSDSASDRTYGHLGFTGTAVFVDPEHDLVYIFLSNRTFPNMNNNKLGRENIRPKVQTAIYNAMQQHIYDHS